MAKTSVFVIDEMTFEIVQKTWNTLEQRRTCGSPSKLHYPEFCDNSGVALVGAH